MAKIVRVYGKADSFDIELIRKGDIWETEIPPDMTDGVYATELTAIDVNGESAFWAGELFMVDGVCCMDIEPLPYRIGLKVNEYSVSIYPELHTEIKVRNDLFMQFNSEKEMIIRKGCCHV